MMSTGLPTPSDASDYTQEGAWNPNQVYTGPGGATGTQKDKNGNLIPAQEVEYLGAYWIADGYTEGVAPAVGYQGAYTGWTLDTSSGAPTPNYYNAVPEAPTGLQAGYVSDSEISLFWNPSAVYGEGDVSSYNVYENGKLVGTTTSTSYTIKGLSASTAYRFQVSAADQSGVSGTEQLVTGSGVNENPYPEANPTISVSTTAPASTNGKYFSPYIDVTLPTTNLETIASGSNLRDFTLAFMDTDKSEFTTGTDSNGNTTWTLNSGVVPTLSWGGLQGATATPTGSIIQQVKDVEAEGGTVTISFGGYNGMDPAVAAQQYAAQLEAQGDSVGKATQLAVANLQSEYQSVITTYGVDSLDFDIENVNNVNDTAANKIRDMAIAGLEADPNDAGLKVSFTLATTPDGLANDASDSATSDDLRVLTQAKAAGITLNTVNIMAMDYYDGTKNMLSAAESAATHVENQLTNLGMTSTLVGITPMIGLNDDTSETFTLADASSLATWAASKSWVAGLGEWEIPRDMKEATAEAPRNGPQPNKSGVVETANYEFADDLDQVTVASGGAQDVATQAAVLTNAAASFTTADPGVTSVASLQDTLPKTFAAPTLAGTHSHASLA